MRGLLSMACGARLHLRCSVILALLCGCSPSVRLELPPRPAVALHADMVAVVARDRACQPVADAVALELTKSSYLAVDPRSPLRIELFGCGDEQALTMEHEQTEEGESKSRVRIEARAHAAVSVSEHGRVFAHLIAAGHENGSSFASAMPIVRIRHQARRRVQEDLARDVVQQLNPLPTLVSRRVYPNAPAGTSRELTTLAVMAEQGGDLDQALQLAEQAWARDPNPRTASYLEELKRRMSEAH